MRLVFLLSCVLIMPNAYLKIRILIYRNNTVTSCIIIIIIIVIIEFHHITNEDLLLLLLCYYSHVINYLAFYPVCLCLFLI
jgi:hypothetical protein